MRKIFLVIAAAMLLASLILTGCSDSLPSSSQEGGNDLNYDLLLQMQRNYVGEADNMECESLEQFKSIVSSGRSIQGMFATLECVDNVFYVTFRHDGDDIMITGKTVSKCKVVSIGEKFNNYGVKNGEVIELVQDYYLLPTNLDDEMDIYGSFGASFIKDSTGATIGMEIEDGDYVLDIKEGVDYALMIRSDVLPMEPGVKYTGAVTSYELGNAVRYLSPVEDTQRYDGFQMSESVMNIAAEIKHSLAN